MYRVTNISGGQLVCTLTSRDTLRLDNGKSQTISDSDLTKYLSNIEKKGLITLEFLSEKKTTTTKSSATATESKEG